MSKGSFTYKIPLEMWWDKGQICYMPYDDNEYRLPPKWRSYLYPGAHKYLQSEDKYFELFFEVNIEWWSYGGSYYDPPDEGEDRDLLSVWVGDMQIKDRRTLDDFFDLFEDYIEDYEFPNEVYE